MSKRNHLWVHRRCGGLFSGSDWTPGKGVLPTGEQYRYVFPATRKCDRCGAIVKPAAESAK